jgi:hypothetical protein
MFSTSVMVATIAGVAAFSGVIVTTLTQMINTRRNQDFELDKEKFRLEFEKFHERDSLTRKKLEKAHIILSEISREFSLTFLTIDWSAKMTPNDFNNKYRDLCAKVDEIQMIVDYYTPAITDSVKELYGLMNHYWGNFHSVLIMEEAGEKVDHTTPSYKEAFNYSRMIPSKVHDIQKKIAEIAHSVINPHENSY